MFFIDKEENRRESMCCRKALERMAKDPYRVDRNDSILANTNHLLTWPASSDPAGENDYETYLFQTKLCHSEARDALDEI